MKIEVQPGEAAAGLNVLLKDLATTKVGKVGWNENAKYPNKKGRSGMQVAAVAVIQELGYQPKSIPPRPFIEPTIRKRNPIYAAIAASTARGILAGTGSWDSALDLIGKKAAGDIRKAITEVFDPPLKPATIAARLRERHINNATSIAARAGNRASLSKSEDFALGALDKPLQDTGVLYGTLINVVENE